MQDGLCADLLESLEGKGNFAETGYMGSYSAETALPKEILYPWLSDLAFPLIVWWGRCLVSLLSSSPDLGSILQLVKMACFIKYGVVPNLYKETHAWKQ